MKILVSLTLAMLLLACNPGRNLPVPNSHAALETKAALQQYIAYLKAQDSKAISELFTDHGRLQHVGQEPVIGRDSIRKFLDSFSGFKVISHEMIVDRSDTSAASVTQFGTYRQVVRLPDGSEARPSGWFRIRWIRNNNAWLIDAALTSSDPIK